MGSVLCGGIQEGLGHKLSPHLPKGGREDEDLRTELWVQTRGSRAAHGSGTVHAQPRRKPLLDSSQTPHADLGFPFLMDNCIKTEVSKFFI